MNRSDKISIPLLLLLCVTAVGITVSGILYRQPILYMIPLYISLVISFLQSKVNRTAYLIGAVNSLLYAVAYRHFKLYASAVYAVLFSCTIQLATYFMWKKNPSGKATIFRALKPTRRIAAAVSFAAIWGILYAILSVTDAKYRFFDISSSLLGILISVMTMLAYIEYIPLMILSQFISIGLYLSMMQENVAQITYLIYTLFSTVCQFAALKKAIGLYKQQKISKTEGI